MVLILLWEYLTFDVLLVLLISIVSIAIIIFVTLVGYLHYQHSLYKHIPGPTRDSFFSGNIYSIIHKTKIPTEVWFDWHLQYGSIFVFWVYHRAVVVVTDPESIKKVLITLNLPKAPRIYNLISYCYGERLAGEGILTELNHEVWKQKRAMLNQAFHRTYLMNLMEAFNEKCDVFLEKIGKLADGKTRVKMTDEFARVTLDVIGKVGFNININSINDSNSPFPKAVAHCLDGMQNSLRNPFWMVKFWEFLYQEKIKKSVRYLRQFAKEVIGKRLEVLRLKGKQHHDILAHILAMAEKNADYSIEKMVDDFGTFFIAGQETTSNQLSFTLLEILRHPNIENRILEELEEVLSSRQFVEYEDLGKLKYLGLTLKESLRMHPPITGTQRLLLQQETLGGYLIPANTPIQVSYFIAHNSPKVWENPEVFDPERFSVEKKNTQSSTQFLPFSAGPRTCIGKTLAEFEAKVIMARLFQKFKLVLVPGQGSSILEKITIKPGDGVLCTITKR